jgi:hypothetical protein
VLHGSTSDEESRDRWHRTRESPRRGAVRAMSGRTSPRAPAPSARHGAWQSRRGNRRPDRSPAIEAALKAVENMFLPNAGNERADARVGRVRGGAASRDSSRDFLLDFRGQPVPQRSTFRGQGGGAKRIAELWRAVYRRRHGLLVPERETRQGEAYGKETLPRHLPQLKGFSTSNPNAVWAIG